MQYEFRGRTLEQAVRRSLSGNANKKLRTKDDAGEQYTCQQLARWIDQLASEAGDLENEINDLQRYLDTLENSYSDNLTNAAIGAATAAAGALGSAARAASTVRRLLRGGGLRLGDVVSAIPYVRGAIVTARSALAAARDFREIREVLDQLDQLESLYDAIEGTANELDSEWDQNRCELYS